MLARYTLNSSGGNQQTWFGENYECKIAEIKKRKTLKNKIFETAR